MGELVHVSAAAQRLGCSVQELVTACSQGKVPGAKTAPDGAWWVPEVWVRQSGGGAPPKPRRSFRWSVVLAPPLLCLLGVLWFSAPGALVWVGVALGLLGGLGFVPKLSWSRTKAGLLLAAGVAFGVLGGLGVRRSAVVEEQERVEQVQAAAMQRREDEQAREMAPETASAWRQQVDAAREQVVERGEVLASMQVFMNPARTCPDEVAACAEARQFASTARAEVAPLQRWLRAVGELDAAAEQINDRNLLIRQRTYDGWRSAVERAESTPDPCPSSVCTPARRSQVSRLASVVASREDDIMLELSSVRQMQLRYADLRGTGQAVSLSGTTVQADTYHNCRFRSQSRWRAFRVTSGLGLGVHGYCRRGADWCDSLYARASAGALRGQAVMRYPRSNSVCEEDQAELIDFH